MSYTLKAFLLKASDKINGVTFSATYIVQPSRKITQFPMPVACKVYGDQCTRELPAEDESLNLHG